MDNETRPAGPRAHTLPHFLAHLKHQQLSLEEAATYAENLAPQLPTPPPQQDLPPTPLHFHSHNLQRKSPIPVLNYHHSQGAQSVALQEITLPTPELQRLLESTIPGSMATTATQQRGKGAGLVLFPPLSSYAAIHTPPDQANVAAVVLTLPHLPPIMLVSVYGSKIPSEQAKIQSILQPLLQQFPLFILQGDLNFCHRPIDYTLTNNAPTWPWMSHQINTGHWVDTFRSLHPTQRAFTRYPTDHWRSATRLDYTLVAHQLYTLLPSPLARIDTSNTQTDHHPITFSFTCPPLLPPTEVLNPILTLTAATDEAITTIMESLEPLTIFTQTLLDSNSPHSTADLLTHTDTILYTTHLVARETLKQKAHVKRQSAKDTEIQRLYTEWQTALPEDEDEAYDAYCSALQDTSEKHEERLRSRVLAALARKRKYTRAMARYRTAGPNIPLSLKIGGQISTDPYALCHHASTSLQTQGGDPKHATPDPELALLLPHMPSHTDLPPLAPPTWEDFEHILATGHKDKSPGPDGVNFFLMQRLPRPLKEWIYQAIVRNWGNPLPAHWNVAYIRLLPKKGDPSLITNYRPIALLSTLYKIHAHVLNNYFQRLHDTIPFLTPIQHGFRPRHRTQDHIMEITSSLHRQPDAYLLLLDLAKAFNAVPLTTLLHILRHRFPPSVGAFVEMLYLNAVDAPMVNGYCLAASPVRRGVRQGCPASPTLFAIYFDPILRYLSHLLQAPTFFQRPLTRDSPSSLHAFADDLALLTTERQHIHTLLSFFLYQGPAFGLTLSVSKTILLATGRAPHITIRLRRPSRTSPPAFVSSFDATGPREYAKYLGVLIFARPNQQLLYDHLLGEADAFFNAIPQKLLTLKTLTMLCNSILTPRLLYRSTAFVLPPQRLDAMQKHIWTRYCQITGASPLTPTKTRYLPFSMGGLGLFHLPTRTATTFIKTMGRYQLREAPPGPTAAVLDTLNHPQYSASPYDLATSLTQAAGILGLTIPRYGRQRRLDEYIPSPPPPPPPMGHVTRQTPTLTHLTLTFQLSLEPTNLIFHDCHLAAQLVTQHPEAAHVFTDGSAISPTQGGFSVVIAPTPTLHHHLNILVGRAPIGNPFLAEALALLHALTNLTLLPQPTTTIIFSDNQALVNLLLASKPLDYSFNKPFSVYIKQLLQAYHSRPPGTKLCWIRAHVGFPGNEVADRYAGWGTQLPLPPPVPAPQAALRHRTLVLAGTIPLQIYLSQIPSHDHTEVDTALSFLPWKTAGPFSKLPFNWQNGTLNVRSFAPFTQLDLATCSLCQGHHAGDALSVVALCPSQSDRRDTLFQTHPTNLRHNFSHWYSSTSDHQRRLFIRGLVPHELTTYLSDTPPLSLLPPGVAKGRIKEAIRSRTKDLLAWIHTTWTHLRELDYTYVPTSQPGPDSWTTSAPRPPPPPLRPYQNPPPIPPTVLTERPRRKRKRPNSG